MENRKSFNSFEIPQNLIKIFHLRSLNLNEYLAKKIFTEFSPYTIGNKQTRDKRFLFISYFL